MFAVIFRSPFTTSLTLSLGRNDPTPDRGSQLPRAASLIISSLGFVHDLRKGLLDPDTVRTRPLDMDQYNRLFGTARIPTEVCLTKVPPNPRLTRRVSLAWLQNARE